MKQLPKVIELIKEASRPVILSGGGVVLFRGWKDLREFVRKIQAPVTSTLMGLGAFPASDPLWLGMIGMHGTYRAKVWSKVMKLKGRVWKFGDHVDTDAIIPA